MKSRRGVQLSHMLREPYQFPAISHWPDLFILSSHMPRTPHQRQKTRSRPGKIPDGSRQALKEGSSKVWSEPVRQSMNLNPTTKLSSIMLKGRFGPPPSCIQNTPVGHAKASHVESLCLERNASMDVTFGSDNVLTHKACHFSKANFG